MKSRLAHYWNTFFIITKIYSCDFSLQRIKYKLKKISHKEKKVNAMAGDLKM